MDSNSEQFQFFSLQSLYSIQSEIVLTYGLVFLLMLIALYFLSPDIKLKLSEYRNKAILKNLGKFQLKDVAIQINLDETVYIDYLTLVPSGIFVLNVMKYNGIIFAGENLEQWTQLVNKKSYKFPNPLHDLEVCESAIRGVVQDCNVIGHIAFESNCRFPKGKPDKISLLHEMPDELEFLKGDVDKQLEVKWNEMKNSDIFNCNFKQKNLSILVKDEQKSGKKIIGILFLISSLLLLLSRLLDVTWLENLFT